MKILLIFFLLITIISCSYNKKVFWCGDHPCINIKEKETYFKKTMIVEVRNLEKKDLKNISGMEKIIAQAKIDEKERIKREKELVKQAKIDEKCIVSSFNPLILFKLKQKRPQTTIGLLYARKTALHCIYNILWTLICRPENLHIHYDLLDSQVVKWARFKGMRINSYTINNKKVYEKAKELKIDGVFTDNIEYIK